MAALFYQFYCPIKTGLWTPDYVYIRNFEPDRWPMGSPGAVTPTFTPEPSELEKNTRIAFADMDASPTKSWLVQNRLDPKWLWYYDLAFGKRPAEELYDVKKDPDLIHNLAGKTEFALVKKKLSERLMKELTRAQDPRVVENPPRFEMPPFTNNEQVK
jgi:N-sulfoglucosamine sulfohydrolase